MKRPVSVYKFTSPFVCIYHHLRKNHNKIPKHPVSVYKFTSPFVSIYGKETRTVTIAKYQTAILHHVPVNLGASYVYYIKDRGI